ncbi:phosphatidylinositol 3,4,5-trisphosphate 3-phosphatase and dual-specificity protein phosphatase PTEN-like [Artemia franciscana]|uniref:phosphatidylinositol 3,4,5-trisphosphate 3-phosphatase and dual-specificity protein phosphatase PTEN-like n=1 Tax=Artemia franciscana TaxID=6661 RepID=UPI0032DB1187
MANPIRAIVSRKKIRYKQDGFDLDLTYILPNLIAMGYPAAKLESIYRNNIDEVIRFLEEKHKNHYRIYNLCSERKYDVKKFQDRVATYPFEDHNPPKLELMLPFCRDVDEWLRSNPENVAAVHCKAGKGRTGLMISCYLLFSGICKTAEDAMEFYGKARTSDRKGVTIPSQRRYVKYFEQLKVQRNCSYQPVALELQEIFLPCLPAIVTGVFAPQVIVYENENRRHTTVPSEVRKGATGVKFIFTCPIVLSGDVKIVLKHKSIVKETLFHFWFNTAFVDTVLDAPLPSDSSIVVIDGSATRVPAFGTAHPADSRSNRGSSHQPTMTPTILGNRFFAQRSSTMIASLPANSSNEPTRGPRLKMEFVTCDLDKVFKDKHSRFGANFKVICIFAKPSNNNSAQSSNVGYRRTRALSGHAINSNLKELRPPLSPTSLSSSPQARITCGPVCFLQEYSDGACNCQELSDSSSTVESESEGGGWDSANDSDQPSQVRYRALSESSVTTIEPS